MFHLLSNLKNHFRRCRKVKRKGRGPGSGRGKTSGRGAKGQGSRSGSRRRYTYEGGQMRLFVKTPCRGFTRGRFKKEICEINLDQIERLYNDSEQVDVKSLLEKKFASKKILCNGFKILAKGQLTKKVTIEAQAFSNQAKQKLDEQKISYKIVK